MPSAPKVIHDMDIRLGEKGPSEAKEYAFAVVPLTASERRRLNGWPSLAYRRIGSCRTLLACLCRS